MATSHLGFKFLKKERKGHFMSSTFAKTSITAELISPICSPGLRTERPARTQQTAGRRGIQKRSG